MAELSAEDQRTDLVERLAGVMFRAPLLPCGDWPERLRRVFNAEHGSLSEAAKATDLERRRMDAEAVLSLLDNEGRLCEPEEIPELLAEIERGSAVDVVALDSDGERVMMYSGSGRKPSPGPSEQSTPQDVAGSASETVNGRGGTVNPLVTAVGPGETSTRQGGCLSDRECSSATVDCGRVLAIEHSSATAVCAVAAREAARTLGPVTVAREAGTCPLCGGRIVAGDRVAARLSDGALVHVEAGRCL